MAGQAKTDLPYWKLSSFYFFYFASLGVMLPYWNPYLYQRGFSVQEISYLTAIVAGTKIFAPYIWGSLADHFQNRIKIIQIASVICLLVFPLTVWVDSLLGMALLVALFSFFWNASLPQFEATTLSHLGSESERYSQIRLWGSIGFIAAVIVCGYFFEMSGISIQPWLVILVFLGIVICSFLIKNKAPVNTHLSPSSISSVLLSRPVISVFLACFIMQFSHGAYYTYYSIYLQDNGYSESVTGWLWALGTFAEIVIFIFMHRLIIKFKVSSLFVACFVLTTIRWAAMAYVVDSLILLILIQLLHAFSFGLFHSAAIHVVHAYFKGRLQGRGQALYSASSFGLGGALGALLSGLLWKSMGSEFTFIAMACIAFTGVFASFFIRLPSDTGVRSP